jgi:hypothetical protein
MKTQNLFIIVTLTTNCFIASAFAHDLSHKPVYKAPLSETVDECYFRYDQ